MSMKSFLLATLAAATGGYIASFMYDKFPIR